MTQWIDRYTMTENGHSKTMTPATASDQDVVDTILDCIAGYDRASPTFWSVRKVRDGYIALEYRGDPSNPSLHVLWEFTRQ